jgi:hypothetical protein
MLHLNNFFKSETYNDNNSLCDVSIISDDKTSDKILLKINYFLKDDNLILQSLTADFIDNYCSNYFGLEAQFYNESVKETTFLKLKCDVTTNNKKNLLNLINIKPLNL